MRKGGWREDEGRGSNAEARLIGKMEIRREKERDADKEKEWA